MSYNSRWQALSNINRMKTFIFKVEGEFQTEATDQDQAFDYLMRELKSMKVTHTDIIEESDNF